MSILLNPDLEQRIAAKVQSGRYRSTDEVIQEGLDLLEARDAVPQPTAEQSQPPIWEIIESIGMSVPDEEWSRVPSDLSKNLDHYLYGAPKVAD
jgi:putative addiction module CopG family antidote